MPCSNFLANAILQQQTPLKPAQPRAPQPKLPNYSITLQDSAHLIEFDKTDKTNSSELPQLINTASTIETAPQDITCISDTSSSCPLNSQFFSPTPSQFADNPSNPPQGPGSNIERLLSQVHWNHCHQINIVKSSLSFQSSLLLSFQSTPPITSLS